MEIVIVLLLGFLTYAIVRAFKPSGHSGMPRKDFDDRATRALVSSLEAEQRSGERSASRHAAIPSKPIPASAGTAAFIDVETTGLSFYDDEVVELAMELIAFDRTTGELLGVVDSYCGLREPSIQISPGAAAVNGLTMAQVRGHRLDANKVRALCERAEFFIAHNASFDRKFTARLFPEVDNKPWLCSMRDIDWYAEGCESRSLASLLSRFCGDSDQAHRASWDASAAVALLSCRDSKGRPFLSQILEAHRANPAGRGAPSKWSKNPAARYRLRGAGGAGRQVCDPHPVQRQPGARHCGVVDAAGGEAELQGGGLVQELPVPGGELGDGAAGGGQGGASLRRIVPPGGIHRDQPGNRQPRGGAVLQQARDSGAMD